MCFLSVEKSCSPYSSKWFGSHAVSNGQGYRQLRVSVNQPSSLHGQIVRLFPPLSPVQCCQVRGFPAELGYFWSVAAGWIFCPLVRVDLFCMQIRWISLNKNPYFKLNHLFTPKSYQTDFRSACAHMDMGHAHIHTRTVRIINDNILYLITQGHFRTLVKELFRENCF